MRALVAALVLLTIPTIDLPGPVRILRRVDFWYRSRLGRGVATVRLFGRK